MEAEPVEPSKICSGKKKNPWLFSFVAMRLRPHRLHPTFLTPQFTKRPSERGKPAVHWCCLDHVGPK